MTSLPQKTIAAPVTLKGVGLHTGEEGELRFLPADPGTGIRFVRTDLPNKPTVRVLPENAHFDPKAGRRTILKEGDVQIHTMEHVLAALGGIGVDNVIIETSTMEIPEQADGSSAPIAKALLEVGLKSQDKPRRHIKVTRPLTWKQNGIELRAMPYQGFRISFTIDYDHPVVGRQAISLDIDDQSFLEKIAPARTFVLERDIEALREAGWIKGGRMESAIVIGKDNILNEEPLRFPDEFVRHKVLDLIGDLTLLGSPVLGHIQAFRSGHQSHVEFVKHLKKSLPLPGRRPGSSPDEWDITAIQDVLPHRYPFLLVDRIIRIEEGRYIEALKNVTINEQFFNGHFPGHPIMPAVLILEAMAQAGGMLLLNSIDDPGEKLMYFMAIDKAKFRRPVTPGDQLIFKLELLKLRRGTSKLQAHAYVDEQLVAEAELTAIIVDRNPA